MSGFQRNFRDAGFVQHYTRLGPPAFMPGHAGVLQMTAVLLRERAPTAARVLVMGAGGGLETRALALAHPAFRFVGVDPAPQMLELARNVIGPELGERVDLIEGTVEAAPQGPFDAATCILVLGLLPDDGTKTTTLREIHRRLQPGAPFVLVDQCLDRSAPDFERRLDRYSLCTRFRRRRRDRGKREGSAPVEPGIGSTRTQRLAPRRDRLSQMRDLLRGDGVAGLARLCVTSHTVRRPRTDVRAAPA